MRRFCFALALILLPPLDGYMTYTSPHIEGDGRIGGFREGGGAIGWVPLCHDGSRVLFSQFAGGYYLDQYVGSAGIGYREICTNGVGVGLNAFVDVSRSTRFHRSYIQGGGGIEVFGNCWEGRVNLYVPTEHRRVVDLEFFDSEVILTNDGAETENLFHPRVGKAFYGGDVEIGFRFCCRNLQVRGYAGYYAYGADAVDAVQGPRLRGEIRMECAQLTFRVGGEWQTDRIHHNDASFLVGASWNVGRCKPCCSSSPCAYLGERVYRQPAPWVLVALEGSVVSDFEEIFIFFVAEGGTGQGNTQLDPTNIQEVQTLANAGDIIILLNDNGTIVPTSTFTLENDQQLGGFLNNPSVTVTLPTGQMVTIPNLNMSGPAVLDPTDNSFDLISLANGNNLFNFETNGGTTTLSGVNTANLTVDSLTMAGATTNGIALTNPSGTFTVTNSTLTPATGATAVLASGGSAVVNLAGLTIMSTGNAGSTGIDVQSTTGGSYTFGPTTLTNHGVDAVFLSGNSASFLFNSTTISDSTGGDGIDMTNQTGNVTFTTGTLTQTAGGRAVNSSGGSAVVNLAGLTIANTGGDSGIAIINTTGGSYTFGPTTLTNNTVEAIGLVGNAAAMTFNNTTISEPENAVRLFSQTGNVTFVTGTSTQNSQIGSAVFISGGSGVFDLSGLTMTNDSISLAAPIFIQNMTGGSVTLNNISITNAVTAVAIDLAMNASTLTLDNVNASGTFVTGGIDAFNNTGTISYSNSTVVSTAGVEAVEIFNNSGPVTFDNVDASGALTTAAVSIDSNTGAVIYQNATISNSTAEGIFVFNPGTATTSLLNNTFPSVATIPIEIRNTGATTTTSIVQGNAETGAATNTNATYRFDQAAGGTMNLTIGGLIAGEPNTGNRTAPRAGILFDNDGTMVITGGTTLSNVDTRNPVGVGGMGVAADNDPAGTIPIPP